MNRAKEGKRYTIKDHKSLIERKYKEAESISELIKGEGDYFYANSPGALFAAMSGNPIFAINAIAFKDECDTPAIFEYIGKGSLKNLLSGDIKEIKNHIIYEKEDILNITIDTSLLRKFYLNKTTINHFSRIIATREKTFYFIKRRDFTLIVAI